MRRSIVLILLTVVATSVFAEETKPAETKQQSTATKVEPKKNAAQPKPPVIKPGDIKLSGKAAPSTASSDSPLVKAAKSGSGSRGKAKLSITDKDVKNSTGKLTIVGTRTGYDPLAPLTETPKPAEDKQAVELKRAREEAQVRLVKAQKDVEDLEKELARLEDDYYSQDNIDYRDNVLEERFEKTKKQLERARSDLAAARDEAQKYR